MYMAKKGVVNVDPFRREPGIAENRCSVRVEVAF